MQAEAKEDVCNFNTLGTWGKKKRQKRIMKSRKIVRNHANNLMSGE